MFDYNGLQHSIGNTVGNSLRCLIKEALEENPDIERILMYAWRADRRMSDIQRLVAVYYIDGKYKKSLNGTVEGPPNNTIFSIIFGEIFEATHVLYDSTHNDFLDQLESFIRISGIKSAEEFDRMILKAFRTKDIWRERLEWFDRNVMSFEVNISDEWRCLNFDNAQLFLGILKNWIAEFMKNVLRYADLTKGLGSLTFGGTPEALTIRVENYVNGNTSNSRIGLASMDVRFEGMFTHSISEGIFEGTMTIPRELL